MIYTDYVHAFDESVDIELEYQSNLSAINECIGSVYASRIQADTIRSFGLFTEAKEAYFEGVMGDAIRNLGQRIINMVKNFQEWVANLFQSLKNRQWTRKDTDKKMELIKRKDPAMVEKVQWAVDAGALDLNSFKDVNDFLTSVDKTMSELEKSSANPKSLKGRLHTAKQKLEENKGTIATVASILGIAATATGIYFNYKKFKSSQDPAKENAQIAAKAAEIHAKAEKRAKALEAMRQRDPDNGDVEYKVTTELGFIATTLAETERVTKMNMSARTKLSLKIAQGYDAAVSKVYKTVRGEDKLREKQEKNFTKLATEMERDKQRAASVIASRKDIAAEIHAAVAKPAPPAPPAPDTN